MMLDMINDIQKAIEAGAYRSAMALALTIPDICGQIAYPEIENIGTRYRKWFNQYVKQYYSLDPMLATIGFKHFDAHACYKLRCAYLHSGNSDLQDVNYIQTLDFFIQRDENEYRGDRFRGDFDIKSHEISDVHITINITKLCQALCMGGLNYYSQLQEKSVFSKFDISIYDSEKEIPEGEYYYG